MLADVDKTMDLQALLTGGSLGAVLGNILSIVVRLTHRARSVQWQAERYLPTLIRRCGNPVINVEYKCLAEQTKLGSSACEDPRDPSLARPAVALK